MGEQTSQIRKMLHQQALSAPKTSGVYLWRDEKEIVIYVGKAKSLKNRLSSYFAAQKDIKTRILVSKAQRLEYIQTENEYEALLLENNLIKKYKPRYNINLKDGKTYPVLKITNEPYPRLYRTRRVQNDGARYFGPFPNIAALDDFLSLIKRNYTLRQCKRLKKREPCLYFHIGRCSAPCAQKISKSAYRKDINEIALLLEGDFEKSVAALTKKMKAAAAAQEFEKAARIRDGIQAVQALRGQSIVEDMDPTARDYIGWAAEASLITFTVLKMRNGKVVGRDLYRTESLKDETEVLPEFLMAYYTAPQQIPPYIFVPAGKEYELAEQWFSKQFGLTVAIIMISLEEQTQYTIDRAAESKPSYTAAWIDRKPEDTLLPQNRLLENLPLSVIHHHRAALAMAQFNAKEDANRRLKEQGDFLALEELQKLLSLEKPPYRIEGFDIAHLQGTHTVASLISFKDGNPDKKNYRIFRLRTTNGIIDDYASMREALARRYTRLVNEAEELPDLILIDGGLGQVNTAQAVLTALDLAIPVIGLAEKNEELYLPHTYKPIVLPRRSPALRVLQRIRDETHRFANARNNRLRSKEALQLSFEQLPYVGKKRAKKLLHNFSRIEKLTTASVEAIAAAAHISNEQALEVLSAAKELVKQ